MAFASHRREEFRTAQTLSRLCHIIQGSLPARLRIGWDLAFQARRVTLFLAGLGFEPTRRARLEQLSATQVQTRAIRDQLDRLLRQRRGSRAHVLAGVEISERLGELLVRHIEHLQRRAR